ncbi:helix-turn-helix domain-containing protein [Herbidospora cretacea]|uniref:helix-turn-helix domain-containing protein n=1 Tax=Herbidospora cretacea TaxID=28444 RepID=UPI00068BBC8E|nr:helix-turn-helix domain-containing protein [Herbidospora cretacea]
MRRYGVEPMLMIDANMQFGPLAVTVIVSWLWRRRSELGPLLISGLTVLTGATVHVTRPEWAQPIIVGTGVAVALVAMLGGTALRLRVSERVYAALTVACIGSWIAFAAAHGPFNPPMPALLAVGTLVLALPWWVHRRRRTRVRVERTLAAWPEISHAIGLTGSRVQSAFVDLWGYRARIGLARGQTVEHAMDRIPEIESALGTRRGAVRVQPIPERANRMEIRVIETDPHADAIGWTGPSVTSIHDPIELGVFEDGTPVRVSFLRRHGLFGGVSGSGKSGGQNVLLGNLTACADTIVWGVDLKRGMELLPWASCLDRIATTPREAEALFRDAVAILDGRAETLAMQGLRVWEPTPDAPALVIVTDEYAELSDEAPIALAHADSIARRGRAPAVQLVIATQRPSQKTMGNSAVRSQMDIRISYRVRERRDVDLILGQGMHKAGWHADKLDAPGKFLISSPDHDIPRRARGYLLEDDTVQRAALRHADRRPTLDEVSRQALNNVHLDEPREQPNRKSAHDADAALLAALHDAPDEGIGLADLLTATGMSRATLYRRLAQLEDEGRARQTRRGRWRATDSHHNA